ncbi:hypothetical protein YC2023_023692 [Brassica napus]
MAKSKSKKKRNLNSQPSSSQIDNRARYFNYMTTSKVYDVVHNNNVLNINLVPTH